MVQVSDWDTGRRSSRRSGDLRGRTQLAEGTWAQELASLKWERLREEQAQRKGFWGIVKSQSFAAGRAVGTQQVQAAMVYGGPHLFGALFLGMELEHWIPICGSLWKAR